MSKRYFSLLHLKMAKYKKKTRRKTASWKKSGGVEVNRVGTVKGGGKRTGGFLGLERKFLDCAFGNITIVASTDATGGELQPSSGCVDSISVPSQGTGPSSRDGRRYMLRSAFVSGVVLTLREQDQADVKSNLGYFFALVLDTQTNAVAINSEDVYTNFGNTAGILPTPLRNLSNSDRFRVLDSKYVELGSMYASTDGASTTTMCNQYAPTVTLNWSGSIECNSVATGANVSSAADNSLHVVAFCGASNLTPTFVGKSRVRFTEH